MRYWFMRILLLLVIFNLSLTACGQDDRIQNKSYALMLKGLLSHSVEEVPVTEFQKMEGRVHLLDARERNEFEVSHIQGAIWVGYDDFSLDRVEGLGLTDTILVYCSVGYRSERIAERLEEAGFDHVRNLYGGIFEWKNRGGEVMDSEGRDTESIHAFDKAWGIWLKKGKRVYN